MKTKQSRLTIAMIVFGSVFLSLACNSGPQNSQNQNEDNANTTGVFDGPCKEGTVDRRIEKLRDKLKNILEHDDELKEQYIAGDFKVDYVNVDDKYIEVYVHGRMSGNDSLKRFTDILNDFMKAKCVARVLFVPPPTPTVTPTSTPTSTPAEQTGEADRRDLRTKPGFEWGTCEYPQVPCANGECGLCRKNDSNTNTNTNANSNANSNADSKYNATNK